MKQFTITKIGYTAGIYGCSGEYFLCILSTKEGMRSFNFYGMYGVEQRVSGHLRELGYAEYYTPSYYGKMTQKDISKKWFLHDPSQDEIVQHLRDIREVGK